MPNASPTQPPFGLSLVIPTLGRTTELKRLIDSIQVAFDLTRTQLIVVDQNGDDRLVPILAPLLASHSASLTHLRLQRRGLSHAKNQATPHLKGHWVSYADDDCWYAPEFKPTLTTHLRLLGTREWLAGVAWDPEVSRPLNRHGARGLITPRIASQRGGALKRIFETAQIAQFYPLQAITERAKKNSGLVFDEAFGVGARFGANEDNDLALSLLKLGWTMRFEPEIRVFHPMVDHQSMTRTKVFAYAEGMGAFARKHRWWTFFVVSTLKQGVGAVLFALRAEPSRAVYFWDGFWGRLKGFLSYSPAS